MYDAARSTVVVVYLPCTLLPPQVLREGLTDTWYCIATDEKVPRRCRGAVPAADAAAADAAADALALRGEVVG